MNKEAITLGYCLMGIGVLDMLFGQFIHENNNKILDPIVVSLGLIIATSASWTAWDARKPWLPPHDPMKNHDGTYQW